MIETILTSKTAFKSSSLDDAASPKVQKAAAEAIATASRMLALSNALSWSSPLYQVERSGSVVQLQTPQGAPLVQANLNTAENRLEMTLIRANASDPKLMERFAQLRS